MKRPVYEVLFRPYAFFLDLMPEKESLKIPALIVLAGGIIAAANGYIIGGLTGKLMKSIIPGMESVITLSSIFGALLGIFVVWVIWTGVIYLISSAFKGEGTFNRALEVTGYGYLPQILGSVIMLVISLQYAGKVHVPALASAAAQDPQAIQNAIQALMHDPAMTEMMQITSVIAIIFLVWSASIWIFGIRHARKLSDVHAAVCVAVPVVAYILYMTYNLAVM